MWQVVREQWGRISPGQFNGWKPFAVVPQPKNRNDDIIYFRREVKEPTPLCPICEKPVYRYQDNYTASHEGKLCHGLCRDGIPKVSDPSREQEMLTGEMPVHNYLPPKVITGEYALGYKKGKEQTLKEVGQWIISWRGSLKKIPPDDLGAFKALLSRACDDLMKGRIP